MSELRFAAPRPARPWDGVRAGGRTFLYEISHPAPAYGLGSCHIISVPLVFGVYAGLGQLMFGPHPSASTVGSGT